VHRQTRIRPRAVVWGLAVAACLFAAVAGPGLAAQQPNPQPLWNAYPLDDEKGASASSGQNASTTTTPAASPASTTTQAPVTVTETAGDGPPWLLMIGAGAGGALFVVLLLTLQGRRARRRDSGPVVGAAEEWPWLTAKANGEGHEFRAERLRNAPGMPTTNGIVDERVADVAPNGTVRERAGKPERMAEPAPNGAARESAVEHERAGEPAPNGAQAERVTEPERAGEVERVAEPERQSEPQRAPEPERVAEPAASGAAAEPAAHPERVAEPAANGAVAEPVAEPERMAEPATNGTVAEPVSPLAEADFDVVEAAAVPRHRFDREPDAPDARPASLRSGPICQVRWSSPGTCFYAATTDVNGVEHRLAWSPPIEWRQPGPPDEDSREGRAAVRVLSKELRDKGWRPMRAKGDDFDEARWYARRFRFPVVEGDDDVAPWQHSPPAAAARGEL
jgi:hypothetical protein